MISYCSTIKKNEQKCALENEASDNRDGSEKIDERKSKTHKDKVQEILKKLDDPASGSVQELSKTCSQSDYHKILILNATGVPTIQYIKRTNSDLNDRLNSVYQPFKEMPGIPKNIRSKTSFDLRFKRSLCLNNSTAMAPEKCRSSREEFEASTLTSSKKDESFNEHVEGKEEKAKAPQRKTVSFDINNKMCKTNSTDSEIIRIKAKGIEPKYRYVKIEPKPEPVHVKKLDILRLPVVCPDSHCEALCLVSSLSMHMYRDHPRLTLTRIAPTFPRQFSLNSSLSLPNTRKCHMGFFLHEKVVGFGCHQFSDCLPFMIMSTRLTLPQLCDRELEKIPPENSNEDLIMIWATGVVPENMPIPITLTAYYLEGKELRTLLTCPMKIYPIRKSQKPIDLYRSGKVMLLFPKQVEILTKDQNNMIELEITVH